MPPEDRKPIDESIPTSTVNGQTTSNLEQALSLHDQGFRVIPLGAYEEAPPAHFIKRCGGDIAKATADWPKVPQVPWAKYQKTPPTREQVEHWWTKWPNANIGILTGFEVYVVDADSPEAIEWCKTYLTKTPRNTTTARGMHFYFGIGAVKDLRNSVDRDSKVDIRGVGGYVVAAGSRHSSGVYYVESRLPHPIADTYLDLPDLTQDDVDRIRHMNMSAQPVPNKPRNPNSLGDLRLYKAQGQSELGENVSEGSRNDECNRLTGLFIHQKFSVSEIMTKIDQWNEGNDPPLPMDELILCVKSTIKTAERKTGHVIPLEPPAEKQVAGLLFTRRQLRADPPPPPEMFWGESLIFRGARVMIAGAPKIGKSRVTLALGVQACIGGQFLNHTFTRPLKFMWIQAEIHKCFLEDRLNAVAKGLSTREEALLDDNLILSGRLDLDLKNERDYEEIRKQLEKFRPDIWAIDPIIDFSTAEENSNVEVRALLRRINELATEFNCAVILVHHTRKPSKEKHTDFDQIRGASAFRGWFDTGLMLTGDPTAPVASWEARNAVSPGAHIAPFNTETGRYGCQLLEDQEEVAERKLDGSMHYGQAHQILEQSGIEGMSMQHLIDKVMTAVSLDEPAALAVVQAMLKNTGTVIGPDKHGEAVLYASAVVKAAAEQAAGSSPTQ